jgi:hypothetical protein
LFWKFWNLTEIEGPFQFKWGSSMGTRIMLWGPPTRTYTKKPLAHKHSHAQAHYYGQTLNTSTHPHKPLLWPGRQY